MANLSKQTGEASSCYYFLHITKQDYDCAFENARKWALKNPEESPRTAARIYYVKEEALQKSVRRTLKRERNSMRGYNTYGGNNKVLNKAQEEAIRQYCYK
jgi:hypothetical protein